MTFQDLINVTLDRIDEDKEGTDPVALSVIKAGINTGYQILATAVDPKSKEITYPFSKSNKLPEDFNEFIEVSHSVIGELSSNDYERRADLLYVTNRDIKKGDVKVTYIAFPASLNNLNDIAQIKDTYLTAISAYGAYMYQVHRKKYQAASMLLNEFNSYLGGEQVEP